MPTNQETPERRMWRLLNLLTKWRAVYASWQLGTRLASDPEVQAVRDHREITLLLRAEHSALIALLVRKGVFTEEEFHIELADEAVRYMAELEARWPGAHAEEDGMHFDATAMAWLAKFNP